jgi:hypothetical protein
VSEPSLPEKIVTIHGRLDSAGIAHAFGGALALAYYAEPRATDDIDLNLFVTTAAFASVAEALTPLGIAGEVNHRALEREGQCRLAWGRTPLDLFFAYDEIHRAMQEGQRLVPFGEDPLPILAPEHLVVCKAIFDRPKDWLDIEQVLVCADDLDAAAIRGWLGRIVGTEDPRSQRLDQMIDALLGS